MSPTARRVVCASAAAAVVALLSGWGIYAALHGVPAFYRDAVQREPAQAARSSDEFLQQAAAAASDVRRPGRWEALFTADQINGWLAVDMPRNYPGLLPDTFQDPRVDLRPGDITLACRYAGPELSAVLTISCDIYLAAPNTVALRIKAARAGIMPLPLRKVIDAISHTARELELPLEWRRAGGDPVALLSMTRLSGHVSGRRRIELDTIELRDGELLVAGETQHVNPVTAAARPDAEPRVADRRSQPADRGAAASAETAATKEVPPLVPLLDAAAAAQASSPPPGEAPAAPAAAAAPVEPVEKPAAADPVDQPLIASPAEKANVQR